MIILQVGGVWGRDTGAFWNASLFYVEGTKDKHDGFVVLEMKCLKDTDNKRH